MASGQSSAASARQLTSDGGARIDDEVATGTGRELERLCHTGASPVCLSLTANKGHASTASEVRALAQRSAEAAKEIKGLISASSSSGRRYGRCNPTRSPPVPAARTSTGQNSSTGAIEESPRTPYFTIGTLIAHGG